MRLAIGLITLIPLLAFASPTSAQPGAAAMARSEHAAIALKVDDRRYKGRRSDHRPHYGHGYYRPYYPPPYAYAYAYPYPYPAPYPYYAPAPYYGPSGGVSLSFGF